MSIVISKHGQKAQLIEQSDFQKENDLQEYIQNNPESIPIYELQEDKRLFVARREFPTNSGPIDALAVDEVGNLYVIETKLYKNPDKRTVVAQALDYGAALWKHWTDFRQFIEILEREAHTRYGMSFHETLKDFYGIDSQQVEYLLSGLQQNLNDGNIKFVILMDTIDDRLRDLILYVNQNSEFDIYAVQLEYYKFDEYEIVIPKIFGIEVKKHLKGTSVTKSWDETLWFQELMTRRGREAVDIVQRFYAWAKQKPLRFGWSSLRKDERATFWIGLQYKMFDSGVFGFRVDGKIEFRFSWLKDHAPFTDEAKRKQFVSQLNMIPLIDIPDSSRTLRGYPSFPLLALEDEHAFRQFCDVIDWCIEEVKEIQDSGNDKAVG